VQKINESKNRLWHILIQNRKMGKSKFYPLQTSNEVDAQKSLNSASEVYWLVKLMSERG
jgi:hypothetical protein